MCAIKEKGSKLFCIINDKTIIAFLSMNAIWMSVTRLLLLFRRVKSGHMDEGSVYISEY